VAADDAGDAADAQGGAGEVDGELAATGMGVVGAGEDAEEGLLHGHAERERSSEVAVVEPGGIVARTEGQGRGDLGDLVAAGREDEAGTALAGEQPHALVNGARGEGEAVDAQEQLGGAARPASGAPRGGGRGHA
jgi:hypothetical protein